MRSSWLSWQATFSWEDFFVSRKPFRKSPMRERLEEILIRCRFRLSKHGWKRNTIEVARCHTQAHNRQNVQIFCSEIPVKKKKREEKRSKNSSCYTCSEKKTLSSKLLRESITVNTTVTACPRFLFKNICYCRQLQRRLRTTSNV